MSHEEINKQTNKQKTNNNKNKKKTKQNKTKNKNNNNNNNKMVIFFHCIKCVNNYRTCSLGSIWRITLSLFSQIPV